MESMRGRKNKSAMKRKKKVVYTSSEEETDDFDSALLGTDGDDTEFDASGVASVGKASNTEPVVTEVVNDEETTGSVVLAEVIVDTGSNNAADNMTLTPLPRGKSMSKLRSMKKSKTQPKRLAIPKEKVTTQGQKMSAEIESALITHGRNTRSAARQELPAAKRTRSRNKKTVRYS